MFYGNVNQMSSHMTTQYLLYIVTFEKFLFYVKYVNLILLIAQFAL